MSKSKTEGKESGFLWSSWSSGAGGFENELCVLVPRLKPEGKTRIHMKEKKVNFLEVVRSQEPEGKKTRQEIYDKLLEKLTICNEQWRPKYMQICTTYLDRCLKLKRRQVCFECLGRITDAKVVGRMPKASKIPYSEILQCSCRQNLLQILLHL